MSKPSRPNSVLRDVLSGEASSGLILMGSAALALLVANSPMSSEYADALAAHIGPLSVLHWINDGLMALFFLFVGLEIKRELIDGRLRTWPDRALPGLAALGGMMVPAAVYLAVNTGSPLTAKGWAIPAATDIAFALGVLALLGSRAPVSLKVFLTALAIIDDLGAVAVIAAFYTSGLDMAALGGAALAFAGLAALNRCRISRISPYLLLGVVLWVFILRSGVHATVAGVLLAFCIPLKLSAGAPDDPSSPLHILEHRLHPWVAFLILPIFGFANAGVSLSGLNAETLLHPVTLGVALGLFVGKQVGVFGAVLLAVKLRLAKRPSHAGWTQIYGVALLCGVGFTMSLFIGLLAFGGAPQLEVETKIGVLVGSLLSMAAGATVLRFAPQPRATA